MTTSANRETEIFETLPVPRAVMAMAIPTIIGQLIVLFYNMADTFFVGQTNNPAMVAGASLILPIFNITIALSGLSGVGGGALISRLLGRKEREEATRVARFSIAIGVLTAAFFSLVTLIFMTPLMNMLGADEETFSYACGYVTCVIVIGAIPTILSQTLSTLLRSVSESKKAGFGITMGGLINIALDPLLMFVLMPKGYEIIGAGIATALSNCISCGYFMWTIHKLDENSVLHIFNKKKEPDERMLPTKTSIKGIFAVGIPSTISMFLFDLDYVVLDRLMSGYGNIALAAIGIVLKVERLPLNAGIGLCQGIVPLIGYNYSAKNYDRARNVVSFSRAAGLIFAAFSVALYLTGAPLLMKIFIRNAQTVAIGTTFLRIRCLATPFMFMSFFTNYFFNAVGRGNKALYLGCMRWLAFNIPMLFILNHFLGIYGLVWSQITADILTVALSVFEYVRFTRKAFN